MLKDLTPQNDDQKEALTAFKDLINLINETVGDAISDLLMVEAMLSRKRWTFQDWNACYTDLPSRQSKVKIVDRLIFKTVNADRQVVKPEGLQAKIDKIVSQYENGRGFVR